MIKFLNTGVALETVRRSGRPVYHAGSAELHLQEMGFDLHRVNAIIVA